MNFPNEYPVDVLYRKCGDCGCRIPACQEYCRACSEKRREENEKK